MRQIFVSAFVVCIGFTPVCFAQASSMHKATSQQTVNKTNKVRKSNEPEVNKTGGTASFTSTSADEAHGNAGRHFSIADPTINLLNERANGGSVPVSSSGIVGMPKGSYGFANGKILLRPTTAMSSGTVYGTGAVGTGTTIMGLGTDENTPGANGKNPYAGPWLWGTKPPVKPVAASKNTRRQ